LKHKKIPQKNSIVQFMGTCQGFDAGNVSFALNVEILDLNTDLGKGISGGATPLPRVISPLGEGLSTKYVVVITV
jgi:hypothetical protein